ncbi:hypothetical protein OOT46_15115 [Aquabacterium sp. A7-Y]|uniref:hypothetical protein n=1 Tax=Aquabacterium sp. A7-Y TaxID=1349605 RepID=UPI00223DFA60|nr:hypothetical protein [Aquabacterium sp. A7-Y]MCW7539172.1 hypothetical protein [Aquabacterium sp. A7-Y]
MLCGCVMLALAVHLGVGLLLPSPVPAHRLSPPPRTTVATVVSPLPAPPAAEPAIPVLLPADTAPPLGRGEAPLAPVPVASGASSAPAPAATDTSRSAAEPPGDPASAAAPDDDTLHYWWPHEVERKAMPEPELQIDVASLTGLDAHRAVLHLWISADGHVDRWELLSATPSGDWPQALFAPLPLTRFAPALRQGRPVRMQQTIELVIDTRPP